MGILVRIFGVLAVLIGVSTLGWIAYNQLIEKQPGFKKDTPDLLLSAIVAVVFIIVGVGWLRRKYED
jgi:hypothetical protein